MPVNADRLAGAEKNRLKEEWNNRASYFEIRALKSTYNGRFSAARETMRRPARMREMKVKMKAINVTMRHPPAQPSGDFDQKQSFLESTLPIARSISSARSKQTSMLRRVKLLPIYFIINLRKENFIRRCSTTPVREKCLDSCFMPIYFSF